MTTKQFSPESVAAALTAHLPPSFNGTFCVGFSGGLDSAVLLRSLVSIAANKGWRVRAIHVDHQLQAMSGDWSAHCAALAKKLEVDCTVVRVSVTDIESQGLESAARTARYAAFRSQLMDGEVLATAHHADDQAETLLLALMRGSGVPGLASMPAIKPFGKGWHARPLLEFTRAEIEIWAVANGIEGISDPSNASLRHDRNFLRHEVMPLLRSRWPATAPNVARSASHLGEASALLDELAATDLVACSVDGCLRIEALRLLSAPRLRNVLRYWLRGKNLPAPSTRKLAGMIHDLFNTSLDRIPTVRWQQAEVHWHRGLVYASTAMPTLNEEERAARTWDWTTTFSLPSNLGTLALVPSSDFGFSPARLPNMLTVRYRKGGEWIQLPGREHRSALRNLLQESDVLPWWRDRLPLVYAGKTLVAVGDLFMADDFAAQPGEAALKVKWTSAPTWRAAQG